jgi:Protein of unknown function (DUF4233)
MSQPAAPPDPWKSFRGVLAGVLVLEAIVMLLAIPVVGVTGRGLTAITATYLIGVAALMVVLSALQRRRWAIWADLAVQLIVIGGYFVHAAIGFIGLLFTGVWLLIIYLRAEVLRRQQGGLLPGQQPPPDQVG